MESQPVKFWMIYGKDGMAPRVLHHSKEAARAEADRLALLNHGQAFVVLEAMEQRKVVPTPVEVTELIYVPF